MNYHVFIVDNNTFKYHLEYMFAGTGASDKQAPFLSSPTEIHTHSTTERNLVGMIADISRIRPNDKIIFYLQASNGGQGIFFGIFKATSKSFFDENDENNYLLENLNKPLTFRIKIEPDVVYPLGITEHYYLDSLSDINYPYQMCWSLIYRKLKGNRGCTMITEHEFNQLKLKLDQANNRKHYAKNVTHFTYNRSARGIEPIENCYTYLGRQEAIDIKDRLLFKANRGNAFEVHLQAFLMQRYDCGDISKLLLPLPNNDCWIGNEVSCGVGMQRIDILIKQEKENDVFLKVIELKCVKPEDYILSEQLPWYIQWLSDYIAPIYISKGKVVHLLPSIIALQGDNDEFLKKCNNLSVGTTINNQSYDLKPVEFISLSFNKNDIGFKKMR